MCRYVLAAEKQGPFHHQGWPASCDFQAEGKNFFQASFLEHHYRLKCIAHNWQQLTGLHTMQRSRVWLLSSRSGLAATRGAQWGPSVESSSPHSCWEKHYHVEVVLKAERRKAISIEVTSSGWQTRTGTEERESRGIGRHYIKTEGGSTNLGVRVPYFLDMNSHSKATHLWALHALHSQGVRVETHPCICTELPGKETICKNAARSTGTLRPKAWPPDTGMMMTGQRGKWWLLNPRGRVH